MHRLGILEEEIERPRKNHKIGKGDSTQKEEEAESRYRQEDLTLGRVQGRKKPMG